MTGFGYVPNVFQNRTGYLPLRELDADLAYASGKIPSIMDGFGVAADGVTDDSAAILAALNAAAVGGYPIAWPQGTYLCSSAISVPNANALRIIGAGSSLVEIKFAAGVNGLSLTYSNVLTPPQLSGLTITTLQPGPGVSGTGLTITGPGPLGVLATTFKLGPQLSDISVRGSVTTTQGWDTTIKLVNMWYPVLTNCNVKGYSASGAVLNSYQSLKGLWLHNVMVPIITNVIGYHINDFIYEDGANLAAGGLPCEGYIFNNCQGIGVRNGVNMGNGLTTITPAGQITNCNFDASFRGVLLNLHVQHQTNNTVVYRTNGSTDNWIGVEFKGCQNSQITDLVIEGNTTVTACDAIKLGDSGGYTSSFNTITGIIADNFSAAGAAVSLFGIASNNQIMADSFVLGPNGTILSYVREDAGYTGGGNVVHSITGYSTIPGAAYTVTTGDIWLVCNRAGVVTLTLPNAAQYTNGNRSIWVKTITNNAVNSASANVVPRVGGPAANGIVAGVAGNWAQLMSNGTNWEIMSGTP